MPVLPELRKRGHMFSINFRIDFSFLSVSVLLKLSYEMIIDRFVMCASAKNVKTKKTINKFHTCITRLPSIKIIYKEII